MRSGLVLAAVVIALATSAAPARASWWPFDDGGHRHHDGKVYPPAPPGPPWRGAPPGWGYGPGHPGGHVPAPGYAWQGGGPAPRPPVHYYRPYPAPQPMPGPWGWAPPRW